MYKRYYHATTPEAAQSILNDGVIKAKFGEVFLCDDPKDAAKFLAVRLITEIVVFGMMLDSDEVQESFDHSQKFFQCKAYVHNGDIKLNDDSEILEYTLGTAVTSHL